MLRLFLKFILLLNLLVYGLKHHLYVWALSIVINALTLSEYLLQANHRLNKVNHHWDYFMFLRWCLYELQINFRSFFNLAISCSQRCQRESYRLRDLNPWDDLKVKRLLQGSCLPLLHFDRCQDILPQSFPSPNPLDFRSTAMSMLHDVNSKDSLCEAVSSLAHTNH